MHRWQRRVCGALQPNTPDLLHEYTSSLPPPSLPPPVTPYRNAGQEGKRRQFSKTPPAFQTKPAWSEAQGELFGVMAALPTLPTTSSSWFSGLVYLGAERLDLAQTDNNKQVFLN